MGEGTVVTKVASDRAAPPHARLQVSSFIMLRRESRVREANMGGPERTEGFRLIHASSGGTAVLKSVHRVPVVGFALDVDFSSRLRRCGAKPIGRVRTVWGA